MDAALADPETERRRQRMGLLARASAAELEAAWAALDVPPEVIDLRGPETGLVMLTGRIGGDGARFNLGEATVSRSTVRLASGRIGFGQLLGSDRDRARRAAVFDALAGTEEGGSVVERLCAAVEARLIDERRRQEAEAASTRVDFFTLVRGED
ncbi:Alpha-D-ribose 1-methylphosphonate 5-triphosphate synthase subunit PhnG [uncultured Pleomorphomonas sp.]|uniref:Alpha-D-ribose 1-methylphosphonate 5-triphosphate synthase subunit PhnG n=1 Tax=uncultured Pleomorphomonas sp. TaxID=442121 RepID=A0A212LBZ9_9HYPH|nr:phosphonate C-P lyase system protein PhnG [uncultured Pleomorphomonas sp.]SCM75086.1 Alpha-D-ribose 1-methylphosphonate 5-triphosphate synthase subunit PhnG [uncultured Pleomorphomonas sp.]